MVEEWKTPPYEWSGSKPEWAIWWALTQIGLKPEKDFIYQSPQAGGRLQLGGAVLDFYLPDRQLAINVQSTYYHYAQTASKIHDQLTRAMMIGWGIEVIFIDEENALADPVYYVKEALALRDHSKATR